MVDIEEARFNLATRFMSNGVGVIVAGDKSTLPGEPNILRILSSGAYKSKLAPSTLKNNVMMMLPLESEIDGIPLMPNQFVTKTCLTTYTYMTTYFHKGQARTESREKVVSNVATEDRNSIIKITPTAAIAGITLTQTPNLSVAEFHTTYTYLNTILDGEQPIVVTSKHTVTNTITAPDDYLSLLQPSEQATAIYDTNTYYSTISLTKTLEEDDLTKLISMTDVLTQVVVTESLPARGTTASVMTSYYALDIEDPEFKDGDHKLSTTDVVKTFFVTYTYYNTFLDNGSTIIKTNLSTASDVVTEKLYLYPKKNILSTPDIQRTNTPIVQSSAMSSFNLENLHIYATKTYMTTFTYFTTLLQDNTLENKKNKKSATVVNSHTRVMENVVTESVPNDLLASQSIASFQTALHSQSNSRAIITSVVTLLDGQTIEVTAINAVKPLKTIEPHTENKVTNLTAEDSLANDILDNLPSASSLDSLANLIESTPIIMPTPHELQQTSEKKGKPKPFQTKTTPADQPQLTKTNSLPNSSANIKPEAKVPDILSSFNINKLSAFGPVINAMAGLIQNNFGGSRKNETKKVRIQPFQEQQQQQKQEQHQQKLMQYKQQQHQQYRQPSHVEPSAAALLQFNDVVPAVDPQSRSPIYIPVGGALEDTEEAESQVMERLNYNSHVLSGNWNEFHGQKHKDQLLIGKLTHESPLLNGGISISPGEIITTNSDVIVGKPSVNGPRGPYQSNYPNTNDNIKNNNNVHLNLKMYGSNHNMNDNLQTPIGINNPPRDGSQKNDANMFYRLPPRQSLPFDQIPQQSANQVSYINENYIGPPPPPPPQGPIQQNTLNRIKNTGQSRYKQTLPLNQRPKLPPPPTSQLRENVFARPPHLYENKLSRGAPQPQNPHNAHHHKISQLPLPPKQQKIYRPQHNVHNNDLQNQYKLNKHIFYRPDAQIHPEILEIHRIPEVYSTDLPPMQIKNLEKLPPPIDANSDIILKQSAYLELPEVVESSTGQPLLVNIQPSQVANVIIPHGSTSALVFGGATEPHKVGQYFNEPSPYLGAEIGIKIDGFGTFSNAVGSAGFASVLPGDINDSDPNLAGINVGTLPDYLEHVNIKPHKPILTDKHVSGKISGDQQVHLNYNEPHNIHVTPQQQFDYQLYHSTAEVRLENQVAFPLGTPVEKGYQADISFSRPNFPENKNIENQPKIVRPLANQNVELHVQHVPTTQSSLSVDIISGQIKNHNYFTDSFNSELHRYNTQFGQHINTALSESDDEVILSNHKDEDLDSVDDREIVQESNQRPLVPGQLPQELTFTKKTETTTQITLVSTGESFEQKKINKQDYGTQTEQNGLAVNIYNGYGLANTSAAPSTYGTTKFKIPTFEFRAPAIQINNELRPVRPPLKADRPTTLPMFDSKKISNHHSTKAHPNQFLQNLPAPGNGNDIRISTGQTEEPFNPKYTSQNPIRSTITPHIHVDHPEKVVIHFNRTTFDNTEQLPVTSERTVDGFELNTGEMMTNVKEIEEIFDYKESVNPHNLGAIRENIPNILLPITDLEIMKPPKEKVGIMSENSNVYRLQNNGQYIVENLKPPPPSVEEVVGLKPPTVSLKVDPLKSVTRHPTTNSPPLRLSSFPIRNNYQRPTEPFTTTYSTTNRPQISVSRKPLIGQHQKTTKKPKDFEISESSKSKKTTDTSVSELKPSYIDGQAGVNDVFILGSEQQILRLSDTSTDKLKTTENLAGNEIRIIEEDIPVTTKIDRNKLILPTKYITNTKTLTVTTTKTTVIKSQGTPPSTLTLTLTKTHTSHVIDTVTETHTLLKPTKLDGSMINSIQQSSIVPTTPILFIEPTSVLSNYPAFPVQATTILGSNQPVLSFNDDDSNLDEFIIGYEEEPKPEQPLFRHKEPTITGDVIPVMNHNNYTLNDNDSIFVVMTDQKKPGIIKINPSMIDSSVGIASHSDVTLDNKIYDLPDRDEDDVAKDVNHILLGGILIASPPRLDSSIKPVDCRPDCKASRNELCQRISNIMSCVCRPGFARMFPDRPCKPTYTYTMKLELANVGKERLFYDPSLADPTSPNYSHLVALTHDSLDRMVMQSDLRDIYHGVHVTGFEGSGKAVNGVLSNFYLQLSDNTDDKRLLDVFKKYLRANNYSLGGTELIAARPLIDLEVSDFDECLDQQFHDCSINARCFNLRGTYTCSCKEGFSDISENPLYSGRACSAEQLGCAKCNYHGSCFSGQNDELMCDCFQWYTGDTCHLNLKLLLIGLVTLGAILFTLLLFCIMMACVKKRKPNTFTRPITVSILPQSSHRSTVSKKNDKKAMILDTSSETSEESVHLPPYVNKKTSKVTQVSMRHSRKLSTAQHQMQLQQQNQLQQQKLQQQQQQQLRQKQKKNQQISYTVDSMTMDQRDRSLTVMIPRARYHPAPATSSNGINNMETFDHESLLSLSTEAKLLNYLDASPPATKDYSKKKKMSAPQPRTSNNVPAQHGGNLVSAGYEVSAVSIGGSREEREATSSKQMDHRISTINGQPQVFRQSDTQSILRKSYSHGELLNTLDDWMDSIPNNDFCGTVSEARSYDETTIHPPTKLLRSLHDKQSSHLNIDEANTMAERDLGSTFLLPHTHLYKPDRGSEIGSGFDSL